MDGGEHSMMAEAALGHPWIAENIHGWQSLLMDAGNHPKIAEAELSDGWRRLVTG